MNKICEGIYFMKGACNSYLIIGDGRSLLINAPDPLLADTLRKFPPIHHLILTTRTCIEEATKWRIMTDCTLVMHKNVDTGVQPGLYVHEGDGFEIEGDFLEVLQCPDSAEGELALLYHKHGILFSGEAVSHKRTVRVEGPNTLAYLKEKEFHILLPNKGTPLLEKAKEKLPK